MKHDLEELKKIENLVEAKLDQFTSPIRSESVAGAKRMLSDIS